MSGGVDMIQFQADVAATMPEIALAVGAMALLLIGVFAGDRRHALVTWACVALLCFVGYLVATGPAEKVLAFSGTMVIDPFARFLKLLVLGGSAIAMLMSLDYLRDEKLTRFEYPLLVTLAT
ncbi:MAG: NADH-quinone oxidoreductase subunit N, partial [Alphaproteobacteria bacterium]